MKTQFSHIMNFEGGKLQASFIVLKYYRPMVLA
jgi:hypothetical protein